MPKVASSVDPLHSKNGPSKNGLSKKGHNNVPNKHENHVIKSYVLRTGRLTKAQKQAFDGGWQQFGLDYTAEILNYQNVFANKNPVWLEVGFGNGDSLYQMAKNMPNTNFIGIEVHTPGVGFLLTLLNKEPLNNLKIFHHDAMDILNNMIPSASLSRFLLFFPDPWPKKKHHKRRFVRPEMINLIASKLLSKGVWHIATDWQPYAEHCLEQFSQPVIFKNLATKDYAKKPDYRPLTKFEQRGLNLGHNVFDCLFELA